MLNDLLAKNQSSDKLFVEDVFSTWLYTGNGSSQTITNGIDLAGKGGMVWLKDRTSANPAWIMDTLRGTSSTLQPSSTNGAGTISTAITAFNANGFAIGANGNSNTNNNNYASWTFRKAPKFFDVVTVASVPTAPTLTTVNHSLGVTPGMIIYKRTDGISEWMVWHRSTGNNNLALNTTGAAGSSYAGYVMNVTASSFQVYAADYAGSYVFYVFAHDTTADGVIQCESYVGNGSTTGPTVTLGWEPQFLLVKSSTEAASNWFMFDTMRGLTATASAANLSPNSANAEGSSSRFSINATGFSPSSASTQTNTNGQTYIYMAIRRGPMRVPTDATKVFNPYYRSGSASTTIQIPSTALSYPPDTYLGFVAYSSSTYPKYFVSRLADQWSLQSDSTAAEQFGPSNPLVTISGFQGKVQVGAAGVVNTSGTEIVDMYLRRAPSFLDTVYYSGTGVARTVSHNLGVAPELMIVKARSTDAVGQWGVWLPSAIGTSQAGALYSTAAFGANGNLTGVSSTTFSTSSTTGLNQSGTTYVAYLFASCPGVSKVGTYTGTGTTNQINCGFTAGARFVLIKRTDSTGGWYFWNSATGIATGNDPYMFLNSNAQITPSTDYIDPYAAGFEISSTAPAGVNANGGTYIYLAIA